LEKNVEKGTRAGTSRGIGVSLIRLIPQRGKGEGTERGKKEGCGLVKLLPDWGGKIEGKSR